MRIIGYKSLKSTNTQASSIADELQHGDVIVAHEQTAGRGQRGNSWESAPGQNLTFSIFLKPESLAVKDCFVLSMAVSVGITEALNHLLTPAEVKIKWPNDIYVGDEKLAGILIENSFGGDRIKHSIIGIGLNVNQKEFESDAPNPVSMAQISGIDYDLGNVLEEVVKTIMDVIDKLDDKDEIIRKYHQRLWRIDTIAQWRLPDGTLFEAKIDRVAPSGRMTLLSETGEKHDFYFKEVFPVI